MAKKMDFGSLLKASTTSNGGDKKKKDDTPFIALSETISENLKKFLEYKLEMKTAETNMRVEEAPIIEHCMSELEKRALKGDFIHSFALKSGDKIVKFVTTDKFSFPSDPEMLKQVEDTLGDKDFEEVTELKTVVTMKQEVFDSEELQKILTDKLGADFPRLFETSVQRRLKSGFAPKMYKIAAADKKDVTAKLAAIKELIPQAKPFLK